MNDKYNNTQLKTGTLPLNFKNGISEHKNITSATLNDTIQGIFASNNSISNVDRNSSAFPENKVSESTLNNQNPFIANTTSQDFKSPLKKASSSILSSIFQFTSGPTAAKNESNIKNGSSNIESTPTKHQVVQTKTKTKNESFMMSPFKIFYKLRSRK
ncbi:hypothetical protein BB561_001987 [Smittium simulii]|uniref:Uncharacterized protein n=1 Tax=Smittium simulii TaxID=133385 RepID=A0A2T9YS47_9FUNG|nr:hypothetical protein BB561_001987 [Smittium simulii]